MTRGKICVCKNDAPTVGALRELGFDVLSPEPEPSLGSEMSEHTDALMTVVGKNKVVLHVGQTALADALSRRGVEVITAEHSFGPYPADVAFNAAVTRDFAVCLRSAVHPVLADALGRELVDARQGYAKCSVCFAGCRGVITEDAGLADIFRSRSYDVLLIEKGDVLLSDRHYGFFGGSTGAPDAATLYINGELKYHRSGAEIKAFLDRLGVVPTELRRGRITDIGSILFI